MDKLPKWFVSIDLQLQVTYSASSKRKFLKKQKEQMMRLLQFRQWPILVKIMTISIISVLLVDAVTLFYFTPLIEKKMMDAKKEGLKNVVDVAYGVFLEYDTLARNGKLSLKEAHEQVVQRIGELRYHEKAYFWINDLHPIMIMHPVQPQLNGTDLSTITDQNGVALYGEYLKLAKGKESGYFEYMWPKPGENNASPKISYGRLFEPWGWILGSGIYVDDVKKDLALLRIYLLAGTLLFTVLTLMFASAIGAGITRPLQKVISGLQDIANGKGNVGLTKRIAITSIDEIGLLSSGFNSVMDSISQLTTFKKVIEEEESPEEVLIRLGEAFSRDLGMRECTIYMIMSTGDRMVIAYPLDLSESNINCNRDILADCTLCKAKRTGHAISSLSYPAICRQFLSSSGKEHYCIPIIVGGGTVAVVQFVFESAQDHEKLEWKETGISKVEQYISESLPVIETKLLMSTLRESALRDPMTGLHNRRYLQEFTEKLVASAVRRGNKIGLIMCDLDYFKQVNDTYGHSVGDIVLKETALKIRQSVRESDVVIRFGGEEFLAVLLDINENDSMMVAEKIRENVQNNKIKLAEGSLSKTISLGVSEFPTDVETFWSCIKYADVALYRAKETGRNRSVRFTKDMWTEGQV